MKNLRDFFKILAMICRFWIKIRNLGGSLKLKSFKGSMATGEFDVMTSAISVRSCYLWQPAKFLAIMLHEYCHLVQYKRISQRQEYQKVRNRIRACLDRDLEGHKVRSMILSPKAELALENEADAFALRHLKRAGIEASTDLVNYPIEATVSWRILRKHGRTKW